MSGGAGGKSFGPQAGGGPAPIQQPKQPDIYQRLGGQPNVDSDPNTEGYQPPTASPMQPPQVSPGMPGGKSGGGKGGFGPTIPRPDIGPGVGIGGGPAPLDPNAPSPLGPQGQQPVTPQPPQGSPGMPGGKSQDQMDFARWNAGRPQTMEALTPESAKAKNQRQFDEWVQSGKPQASNGGKGGFAGPGDMSLMSPEMQAKQNALFGDQITY